MGESGCLGPDPYCSWPMLSCAIVPLACEAAENKQVDSINKRKDQWTPKKQINAWGRLARTKRSKSKSTWTEAGDSLSPSTLMHADIQNVRVAIKVTGSCAYLLYWVSAKRLLYTACSSSERNVVFTVICSAACLSSLNLVEGATVAKVLACSEYGV